MVEFVNAETVEIFLAGESKQIVVGCETDKSKAPYCQLVFGYRFWRVVKSLLYLINNDVGQSGKNLSLFFAFPVIRC